MNALLKLGSDLTILNESGQKVGDLITKNTDPLMVKSLGKYAMYLDSYLMY